jgi:hypothetical protein
MARYRAEVMIDRTPQTPFMMVIKSASRKFLTVSRGRGGMNVCSELETVVEIEYPAVHLSRIGMKRPKKVISTYRTSEKCPSSFLYCCNNFFFS